MCTSVEAEDDWGIYPRLLPDDEVQPNAKSQDNRQKKGGVDLQDYKDSSAHYLDLYSVPVAYMCSIEVSAAEHWHYKLHLPTQPGHVATSMKYLTIEQTKASNHQRHANKYASPSCRQRLRGCWSCQGPQPMCSSSPLVLALSKRLGVEIF